MATKRPRKKRARPIEPARVLCNEPGCGRTVRARGLCQTHYKQQREHGRTWAISRVRPPRKEATVRLASGQRVTHECADVLKRVAEERGQAMNRVVTDIIEAWVKRRGTRRSR